MRPRISEPSGHGRGDGRWARVPDAGGTHQAIEDVSVAMACPNLEVLAPCDPAETSECIRWCARRETGGPVYIRIGKAGEKDVMSTACPWEFGKMRLICTSVRRNLDMLLVTYGPILAEVMWVAWELDTSVMCVSRLSDISEDDYYTMNKYREIVVVEEASGAPLASAMKMKSPWAGFADRIISFALPRGFPHAHGTREELLSAAGLTAEKMLVVLGGGG